MLKAPESIVLVGCGSIGLPLAVALASSGRPVLGIDTDIEHVERLSRGRCTLAEPDLESRLRAALEGGTIGFASAIQPADQARAFIISVPTPASEAGFNGAPLEAAATMIAKAARKDDLVCVRSTVPIGTTRRLALAFDSKGLRWASCPDRSVSGRAFVDQFETPHLIGGLDAQAEDQAAALFGGLAPIVRVRDPETSEAIKLFCNVSRDVTFALANQFAMICDAAGIDISEVRAAGSHGYSRFQLARPGPVGGPCLSKDVHVLAASEAAAGLDLGLLTSARSLNETLAPRLADDILQWVAKKPGPVAILGMAFKGTPATPEQRHSFGGDLRRTLLSRRPDLEIRTWDPVEAPDPKARDRALGGAAVVVLANDHPALAAAVQALPSLAPHAFVYDLAGAAPLIATESDICFWRFGAGRAP